jgi:lysyl-tRNA synthetase class 2
MTNPIEETNLALDENEQIHVRREKLSQLRKTQKIVFPNDFKRTHVSACLHSEYGEKSHDDLELKPVTVKVAGRMMLRRLMGKASFCHLQDMGGQIQVYVKSDELSGGSEAYEQFKHWDIGDILGVEGVLFKTKTGELSIRAKNIKLLTKALRPLPDKFHGLSEKETCYRQRYLDLIVNEQTRNTFKTRSKVVQAVREFLTGHQFTEVETPMMQAIPGGATARPFETHHHALDMKMYLRIAPELYLKRLVVGGMERVFEINRNFRNEGISTRHNPEFTMLEYYCAYQDYQDAMTMLEDMFKQVSSKVLGKNIITYQNQEIDFGQPFLRISMADAVLKYNPEITKACLTDVEKMKEHATKLNIKFLPTASKDKLLTEIFEATVEHNLIQPTFVTEYPTEISPLARKNDLNPDITDRFELIICGRELANGFSELNDAEDQDERFKKQVEQLQAGDNEAMHYDSDYITALEHGLAPCAGVGIGIDRFVMLLTDSPSIRDVILFPHLRLK